MKSLTSIRRGGTCPARVRLNYINVFGMAVCFGQGMPCPYKVILCSVSTHSKVIRLFHKSQNKLFAHKSPSLSAIGGQLFLIWLKCRFFTKKYVQHSKQNPFTNDPLFW